MTSTPAFTISCDDCTQRCSTACDECVVTFVLQTEDRLDPDRDGALILDLEQERVVRWMARAGLVPDLRFERAG